LSLHAALPICPAGEQIRVPASEPRRVERVWSHPPRPRPGGLTGSPQRLRNVLGAVGRLRRRLDPLADGGALGDLRALGGLLLALLCSRGVAAVITLSGPLNFVTPRSGEPDDVAPVATVLDRLLSPDGDTSHVVFSPTRSRGRAGAGASAPARLSLAASTLPLITQLPAALLTHTQGVADALRTPRINHCAPPRPRVDPPLGDGSLESPIGLGQGFPVGVGDHHFGRGRVDLPSRPRLTTADLRESGVVDPPSRDRKSTRLNSSHVKISYAVFCLKNKK